MTDSDMRRPCSRSHLYVQRSHHEHVNTLFPRCQRTAAALFPAGCPDTDADGHPHTRPRTHPPTHTAPTRSAGLCLVPGRQSWGNSTEINTKEKCI